jgi:hypothetical protein
MVRPSALQRVVDYADRERAPRLLISLTAAGLAVHGAIVAGAQEGSCSNN